MIVHDDQHVNVRPAATTPAALRVLYRTLLAAQTAGAVCGVVARHAPTVFEQLWTGAAVATLPGYLVGWWWLRRRPDFMIHRTDVARVGLAAAAFALAGIAVLHG